MKIEIRRAEECDLKQIVEMIEEAKRGIEKDDWFIADDEDFVRSHLGGAGGVGRSFTLVAEADGGELAGYLIVRQPGTENDNLGRYLETYRDMEHEGKTEEAEQFLNNIYHMESAAVTAKYAGNHIQYRLMEAAEEMLRRENAAAECAETASTEVSGTEIQDMVFYLCGTVHPDNKKSLHTFQKLDYRIIAAVKKYGGFDRYVMAKAYRRI